MKSVNKVILVGNITRDPQLKETTSNQPIVTFGLATNREWITKSGEKRSLAEYHNIAAWGHLAEICHQYLKKGKLIYVEGYLKTRSWDSPEGIKMFRTEVVIQDMIILSKRQENDKEDLPEFETVSSEGVDENVIVEEDEKESVKTEEKKTEEPAETTNEDEDEKKMEGDDLNF